MTRQRIERLESKIPRTKPNTFVYARDSQGDLLTEGALAQTPEAVERALNDPHTFVVQVRMVKADAPGEG